MKICFRDAYIKRLMFFEYTLHWTGGSKFHARIRQIPPELFHNKKSAVGNVMQLQFNEHDTDIDIMDAARYEMLQIVSLRSDIDPTCTAVDWLEPIKCSKPVEVNDGEWCTTNSQWVQLEDSPATGSIS